MINNMKKFGVRQRCMDGNRMLIDLLMTSLHYERDLNFYICEEDGHFLGIINRKILLKQDIEEGKYLPKMLNDMFMDYPVEEAVIVDEKTGHIAGIVNRREFFNEMLTITPENDEEMVCYREFGHFYKPCGNVLNQYAHNINSQHGEDGILKAIFDKIGTTSKYVWRLGWGIS